MIEIELRRRRKPSLWAVVDDEDAELVAPYRWCAHVQPHTIYVQRNIVLDGHPATQMLHTLITGWFRVDHIDHNGLNNRRSNLRQTNGSTNAMNSQKRRGCQSRFKGVCRDRYGWRAYIGGGNTKRTHLGCFSSEEEAALAYDRAAIERFGEFAHLNFPVVLEQV